MNAVNRFIPFLAQSSTNIRWRLFHGWTCPLNRLIDEGLCIRIEILLLFRRNHLPPSSGSIELYHVLCIWEISRGNSLWYRLMWLKADFVLIVSSKTLQNKVADVCSLNMACPQSLLPTYQPTCMTKPPGKAVYVREVMVLLCVSSAPFCVYSSVP